MKFLGHPSWPKDASRRANTHSLHPAVTSATRECRVSEARGRVCVGSVPRQTVSATERGVRAAATAMLGLALAGGGLPAMDCGEARIVSVAVRLAQSGDCNGTAKPSAQPSAKSSTQKPAAKLQPKSSNEATRPLTSEEKAASRKVDDLINQQLLRDLPRR